MTVSYASEITTSRGFGLFWRLLGRWRGSIYKLIWADLLIYIFIYYAINCTYRFALNAEQQHYFEKVVQYCSKYASLIPLSFVLGFYVNIVMTRWWNQFETIPYPDNLALLVSAGIKGDDEHCRIIRRTIGRYVCLSFATTLTLISPKVKRRFPTLKHLVEAGLLMPDEERIMAELQEEYPNYPQFWLPLAWASNIAAKARQEGLIRTDQSLQGLLQEINTFRTKCGGLLNFDWISIPLVYTQVVTIAVYSYFVTSVIGQQYTNANDDIDLYFPVLAVLEFFFYMGWLRVAETLINPFGEDDDDFDVVWMVDRHVQVTYLIVDKIHDDHPTLMQDQYWNSLVPRQLSHTVGSEKYIDDGPQNSTAKMNITTVDATILPNDGSKKFQRQKENIGSFKRNNPSLIRRLFRSQSTIEEQLDQLDKKNALPLTSVTTDAQTNSGDGTRTPKLLSVPSTPTQRSPKMVHVPSTPRLDEVDEHEGQEAAEVIDFEKLKRLRQLLLKQKVIKYMDLVKEHTPQEEDKIIEDIMHVVEEDKDKNA